MMRILDELQANFKPKPSTTPPEEPIKETEISLPMREAVPMQEPALSMIAEDGTKHGTWTYLADSVASTYMGPTDEGMFDYQDTDTEIKVGNGKTVKAIKTGKKRCTIVPPNGKTRTIILEGYKHVPNLWTHLFSLTRP